MENIENNKSERWMLIRRSALTGFIGGLLGGAFWTLMYYFNFSEFAPRSFLLSSWIKTPWVDGWKGDAIAIIIIGFISILIACIYYVTSKKINSILIGILYGIILWVLFFYLLLPIIPNVKPVVELNKYTIFSTICLFVLYGTFIGYSISYDYFDTYVYDHKEKN